MLSGQISHRIVAHENAKTHILFVNESSTTRSAQYVRLSLIPVARPIASKQMTLSHRVHGGRKHPLPNSLRI